MKRIMMIMLTIMMLNSCYYADQVFGDIKDERETVKTQVKEGGGAYKNEKYESGVYEAIKDVAKRPMNKKEKMDGLTLILPENTSINTKMGNVIDLKTGYGIPIIFSKTNRCPDVFYHKKISPDSYYSLSYNRYLLTDEIAQKIIRANGFTKTCSK